MDITHYQSHGFFGVLFPIFSENTAKPENAELPPAGGEVCGSNLFY